MGYRVSYSRPILTQQNISLGNTVASATKVKLNRKLNVGKFERTEVSEGECGV